MGYTKFMQSDTIPHTTVVMAQLVTPDPAQLTDEQLSQIVADCERLSEADKSTSSVSGLNIKLAI